MQIATRRMVFGIKNMLLICGVLTWLATPNSQACYSGLGLIPTTDTLEPGKYSVELQFDGPTSTNSDDTTILNTQYGFSRKMEAGVDVNLGNEDSTALLNFKYRLIDDDKSHPAVAIGVCNTQGDFNSDPYIVASHSFPTFRTHLGMMRISGTDRLFVGFDRPINDRLTLMVDYITGRDNYGSIGGSYQFSDKYGIMAAVELPNTSANDLMYTVHFVIN